MEIVTKLCVIMIS